MTARPARSFAKSDARSGGRRQSKEDDRCLGCHLGFSSAMMSRCHGE